jgi:hypothetical protein
MSSILHAVSAGGQFENEGILFSVGNGLTTGVATGVFVGLLPGGMVEVAWGGGAVTVGVDETPGWVVGVLGGVLVGVFVAVGDAEEGGEVVGFAIFATVNCSRLLEATTPPETSKNFAPNEYCPFCKLVEFQGAVKRLELYAIISKLVAETK